MSVENTHEKGDIKGVAAVADLFGDPVPTGEETYSDGEGPECPRCHAVWTADDKEYFDEANGMKMKCSCGAQLFIQPETHTTWTTTVVSSPNVVDMPPGQV